MKSCTLCFIQSGANKKDYSQARNSHIYIFKAETMNVVVGNINVGLKAPNALRPERFIVLSSMKGW